MTVPLYKLSDARLLEIAADRSRPEYEEAHLEYAARCGSRAGL